MCIRIYEDPTSLLSLSLDPNYHHSFKINSLTPPPINASIKHSSKEKSLSMISIQTTISDTPNHMQHPFPHQSTINQEMGKKMKFPFIFKTAEEEESTTTTAAAAIASSWQWPSCMAQKTLSFRGPAAGDIFKTMNSAYDTAAELDGGDQVEALISGLRTAERLFFEPGETSSILGELKRTAQVQSCHEKEESSSSGNGGGGVLVAMDSMDPYLDFKTSMEEMVEAHGMKEWDQLEELLGWYLKANGKENHGYIVGAFADLLVRLVFSSSSTTTTATSSSSTCLSDSEDQDQNRSFSVVTSTACSRSLSSLEAEEEIDKTVDSRSNGC